MARLAKYYLVDDELLHSFVQSKIGQGTNPVEMNIIRISKFNGFQNYNDAFANPKVIQKSAPTLLPRKVFGRAACLRFDFNIYRSRDLDLQKVVYIATTTLGD